MSCFLVSALHCPLARATHRLRTRIKSIGSIGSSSLFALCLWVYHCVCVCMWVCGQNFSTIFCTESLTQRPRTRLFVPILKFQLERPASATTKKKKKKKPNRPCAVRWRTSCFHHVHCTCVGVEGARGRVERIKIKSEAPFAQIRHSKQDVT